MNTDNNSVPIESSDIAHPRPDLSSVINSRHFEIAKEDIFDRPTLCIIVDAEEEFNWTGSFSRDDHSVFSIQQQYLAHEIYDRYDARPTYLVDYPIAASKDAQKVLSGYLENEKCELGVQLHPWVNPPFVEELSTANSYLCNLPKRLVEQKLEVLTAAVAKNFAVEPIVFKAGRYGFDDICAEVIEAFGYEIDTSVVPHTSFAGDGGPSFIDVPNKAFWFGTKRKLLELPVTRGYTGLLRSTRIAGYISRFMDSGNAINRKLPGGFSRSQLLERITLTPEGIDHRAHRRLMENLIKDNRKLFCFSYHSSSLLPGNTPYVRDEADLEIFLQRIDKFLDYFVNELGGRLATPQQIASQLKHAATQQSPAKPSNPTATNAASL